MELFYFGPSLLRSSQIVTSRLFWAAYLIHHPQFYNLNRLLSSIVRRRPSLHTYNLRTVTLSLEHDKEHDATASCFGSATRVSRRYPTAGAMTDPPPRCLRRPERVFGRAKLLALLRSCAPACVCGSFSWVPHVKVRSSPF